MQGHSKKRTMGANTMRQHNGKKHLIQIERKKWCKIQKNSAHTHTWHQIYLPSHWVGLLRLNLRAIIEVLSSDGFMADGGLAVAVVIIVYILDIVTNSHDKYDLNFWIQLVLLFSRFFGLTRTDLKRTVFWASLVNICSLFEPFL